MKKTINLPKNFIDLIIELQNNGKYTETYIFMESLRLLQVSRNMKKKGFRLAVVNDDNKVVANLANLSD